MLTNTAIFAESDEQTAPLACFKAYDIRGKLGVELNEDVAYRIGRAYTQWLKAGSVVLGGDVRNTSAALKSALASGLRDEGVNVYDIGLCGTEEVYFATAFGKTPGGKSYDGGIMVTASHNPIDYNGLKLVRENAKPISADTGLATIKELAEQNNFGQPKLQSRGAYNKVSHFAEYIKHLLGYIDASKLKPLKIVVNAGNGNAGQVLDGIENLLPFELIKIHHAPNGEFPNGIPNPMLIEQQHVTAQAVRDHKADFGLAWDGDFARCFFFNEAGEFIEGYYLVGLLAEAFLQKESGAKIVHDPRLIWNTQAICTQNGGQAIQSKCGHSFIKEIMREQDAVYGGEMSAHHYFRDFAYCDSGMIPWLLVAELLSIKNQKLSDVVRGRIQQFPCSGEINRKVEDADATFEKVLTAHQSEVISLDKSDGISLDMGEWRLNLRKSNTEPLVRLNVESRGDEALMHSKTKELLQLFDK